MTLRVILHELAERELNDAAAYYALARPGLGEAFLASVQRAVGAVAAVPLAGAVAADDVRKRLVTRFPYCVFYRVHADHIRVLAIAHQRRRPFYWRSRR